MYNEYIVPANFWEKKETERCKLAMGSHPILVHEVNCS